MFKENPYFAQSGINETFLGPRMKPYKIFPNLVLNFF